LYLIRCRYICHLRGSVLYWRGCRNSFSDACVCVWNEM